ncbi:MAG: HNH endonuclease signature motif containing protein [Eubacteriales bacterium]|nr:HNH endonuclease signature motif containing protein [Eubacteriales bacterium]
MSDNRVAGYLDSEHPQRKYYYCKCCGKPFWKPDAFRMKYCSKDCQKKAYSITHPKKEKTLRPKIIRKCGWCGQDYEAKSKTQKYCCKNCAYEGNKKLHREKWADAYIPQKIKCKECGSEFMTECGNTRSVFCCQSCAEKHERRIEHKSVRHKSYMRELKRKREIQISRQTVGAVSYKRLYQQYHGVCAICGLPVHKDKFIDDNWGGTIDHIIPVSLGGVHGMSNCQLSHRICNSLKCKNSEEYSIDWEQKSLENNYWKTKYQSYKELMSTG